MGKYEIKYLDKNVVEASRERIKKILSENDEVWVSFSGGKDSLVVLSLFEEQVKEKKINVVFRDEEVIPSYVVDFVLKKRDSGKYNFVYVATELKSDITILGVTKRYIQWDRNRKWIREKPKGYVEFDKPISQNEFEKYFFRGVKKKIGLVLGMRAEESLFRRRNFVNSPHPLWRKSELKNVTIYNPIYDWSEKDIFKYLYDNNIEYCKNYDFQLFSKVPLRVASLLHSENTRMLEKLKTIDPIVYDQIIDIFPEVELQVRYGKQVKKNKNLKLYIFSYKKRANGDPYKAILIYIDEELKGIKKKEALKCLLSSVFMRKNKIKKSDKNKPFGGYPLYYVFEQILKGKIKRLSLMPTKLHKEVYYEYEDLEKKDFAWIK